VISLAAQPAEKGALERSVSRRSVFARRCSRDTATLDAWIWPARGIRELNGPEPQ
jgi:hypothetical protein